MNETEIVKLELGSKLKAIVGGNEAYVDSCVRLIDELIQLRIAEALLRMSSGGK
jgi:hypothetical protein